MVSIRTLRESDLREALDLHNQYTAQDRSLEEFRAKYRATPSLFLGAYGDQEMVGICLGWPIEEEEVELVGIGIAPERRGCGIGSRLLEQFEIKAADVGTQKITLGSAGGDVDRFYVEHGYSPSKILVRHTAETVPADFPNLRLDVVDTERAGDTLKIYLGVDEYDLSELETVRNHFQDDDAIYIMEKALTGE